MIALHLWNRSNGTIAKNRNKTPFGKIVPKPSDAISRKMEVLKYSKICFTLLGNYPLDKFKKPYDEIVQTISFYFYFVVLAIFTIFNCDYISENLGDIFRQSDSMVAFIAVIANIGIVGSYVSLIIKLKKFDVLKNQLQEIVNKSKNKLWYQKVVKCQARSYSTHFSLVL